MNKRYSHGFQIQASYVRSKALGDFDGNTQSEVTSFLTLRNEHLDKRLLSFDVPNALRTSGVWDLPFGKGRKLVSNGNSWVERLVGGWQTSIIYNHISGTPTTFATSDANSNGGAQTFNGLASSTAVLTGSLPTANVHVQGNNVLMFSGLSQTT